MSEKIELIDAKDLPMTEEEDVTVLCVGADGEMVRRDAGSFVGGYILKPTADEITIESNSIDITTDCTEMVKALEAGANVMVLIPANGIGVDAPAMLRSVILWAVYNDMLAGVTIDSETVRFPNAPIPSFLQG